jgi:hypothetical protein
MLTETRGLSIGAASVVLTSSSLAWAAGSWWQSRGDRAPGDAPADGARRGADRAGAVVVAAGLLDVPLVVPYVGWAIGGVGMGIVFPTIRYR